ncbi:MAG: hypothetical protein HY690_17800 [Chloroflexi bacterium]|nr:hypothetical protein [Chloroflexota bacterium]
MSQHRYSIGLLPGLALVAGALALALLMAGTAAGQQAAPSAALLAADIKLLKTQPEVGPVGTSFTITGQGLPPGTAVDLIWMTSDGSYATRADQQTVEFQDRVRVDKRVSLGSATTDADGQLRATLTAPEDYGDIHDLYVEADGQQLAKGGFRIEHQVSVSPLDGPVGAEITIKATGLTLKPYTSTLGVLYDNRYAGFISATTTRGTAEGKIRAAGPLGGHLLEVYGASQATPFLNPRQGASGWKEFRVEFKVTSDDGPPPLALDWPDEGRLAKPAMPITTASGVQPAPGVSAAFEPASGPILSTASLGAVGLPPDTSLDLIWVTVVGNRVQGGWNMVDKPLGKATTSGDGALQTTIQVPDDLGGWHVVKLVQGKTVLVEVPYFVEHSLVQVNPRRVKAGEPFTVQIKGIGWTELDNGVAVTYDSAYMGYACGFNSGGDITLNMVATGGPGTHLVDLYPMIYQGHGKPPWSYQMPQLTFAQDAPGLALGYRLPTFRLAIEVYE